MKLFHRHSFKVVAANQLERTDYGYFLGSVFVPFDKPTSKPKTEVLYVCLCGKHKTESLMGHWTLEELRGATPGEPAQVKEKQG